MEVKQLDPNPEERRQQAEFDAGKGVVFGGTPGTRIRRAIDDGYPQLRELTGRCRPGVLVIYDNVHLPTIHVDPYSFKTGMYGLEKIILARTPDSIRSRIVDTVFGPKRKVGPERNKALSAVAHLYRSSAEQIGLDVYHNLYAALPLNPRRLGAPSARHFRLSEKQPGVSQEWEQM